MASKSESQAGAPNSVRAKTSKTPQSRIGLLEVAGFLLFVVPITLPFLWSPQTQQWLVPAVRPYLPAALQTYLPVLNDTTTAFGTESRPSLEDLIESCDTHQYTSEIVSLDPLVIYINNFTSSTEAEELINIGSPDFVQSYINNAGGNQKVSGRTSTSAPLPLHNPLVKCILDRARTFMGSMLLPHEPFSVPQLVRYFPSQKYDLHTDFWPQHQVMRDGSNRLFNRVASFFVFLRDNCTDGYTYFPRVQTLDRTPDLEQIYNGKIARGGKEGEGEGVKFKPIQGNAVFWVNIDEKGNGDKRLIHAGLPVGEGEKIGLNLWPRKFYGVVGDDEEKKRERKEWSGKWKD